ncbi:MAG TPA: hypothetical protein V6D22_08285 [Candidatus Obscuribacterales bacterium]
MSAEISSGSHPPDNLETKAAPNNDKGKLNEQPEAAKSQPEAPKSADIDYLTIAADCGKSFLQSAGMTPIWNGLGELVSGGNLPKISILNEENAKSSTADRWAQNIGGALGIAADIFALSKLKPLAFGSATTAESLQAMSSGARALTQFSEGAKLGAFYGGVLTPSDPDGNLVTGRLKNIVSQGLTFGLLGGGAEAVGGLKSFAGLRPGGLANALTDVGISGAVGAPVGIIGTGTDALLNGKTFGSEEMKQAAVDYGVIGMAMTGLTHGVAAFKSRHAVRAAEAPGTNAANITEARTADGGAPGNAMALASLSKSAEEHIKTALGDHDFPGFSGGENAFFAGGFNDLHYSNAFGSDYGAFSGFHDFEPDPSRVEPSFGGRSLQEAPSLDDLKKLMQELKSKMAEVEIPTSAKGQESSARFIPEKATQLDAHQLELGKTTQDMMGSTEIGDKIVGIKRYINTAGEPAGDYLARLVKNSDVTIIGEQHTMEVANPNRELGKQIVTEMPAGSTLAVELPESLKEVFDKFNKTPGSEILPHSAISDKLSLQPGLRLLRALQANDPDLVEMWKAARDKGVRVVPIDAETENYNGKKLTDDNREGTLANEVLALHRADKSKPVVVWIGDMHAAKTVEDGVPLLAKRVAESPEFASGESKLSTVLSQISETEADHLPLQVLAKDVSEPVAMPTTQKGQPTPLSDLPGLDERTAKAAKAWPKVADWDHVIMYPPAPRDMRANFFMRKAESLMADLTSGKDQFSMAFLDEPDAPYHPQFPLSSRVDGLTDHGSADGLLLRDIHNSLSDLLQANGLPELASTIRS